MKIYGIQMSAATLYALRKLHKVQSPGEGKRGPQVTMDTVAKELFERAVIEAFEGAFGHSIGADIARRHSLPTNGGRHCAGARSFPSSLSEQGDLP